MHWIADRISGGFSCYQGRAQDFSKGGAQSGGHPGSGGGFINIKIRIQIWNSGYLSCNNYQCLYLHLSKIRVARAPPPPNRQNHMKQNLNITPAEKSVILYWIQTCGGAPPLLCKCYIFGTIFYIFATIIYNFSIIFYIFATILYICDTVCYIFVTISFIFVLI